MGGFLTQPVTTKQSNHGEGLGLRYGLSSMQGWRPEMEDAHDVRLGLNYGLDDWSFFAVFDGHAGKHTAAYSSVHLLDYILRDREFKLINEETPKTKSDHDDTPSSQSNEIANDAKSTTPPSSDDEQAKLDKTTSKPFTLSDKDINSMNNCDQLDDTGAKFKSFPITKQLDMVKDAIRSGFLCIDTDMRANRRDMSGSTAICSFISPTHVIIANCGDSRAVYCLNGLAKFATEDHKPFNPIERRRIIKAGGTATERVNGTLAVSRSLGDFDFKKDEFRGPCEQLVSPEPDITIIKRDPKEQFLILACDGIWDVMSNDELCKYVNYMLKIESNLETICSSVLDVCLRKGSRDNMSIIIVVFPNGPKVEPELKEKALENDKKLIEYLDSIQSSQDNMDFGTLLSQLEDMLDMNIQELTPPGAGIRAKYDMLRERFNENVAMFINRDLEVDEDDQIQSKTDSNETETN